MPNLKVKRLPTTDVGRLLVRLNISHRYGVAKIEKLENNQCILALVLGHVKKNAIFMPFDIRTALGVQKEDKLSFSIEQAHYSNKLLWYLRSPDPAVHIPAWLALISVALGIVGIMLGLIALRKLLHSKTGMLNGQISSPNI